MEKILFVCLGNICRSPLAEGIMLHLKEKLQLSVEIDSAGTSNFHIGESPDKRTVLNARKNGIDLSKLKARQFVKDDFYLFDKIFVMDKSNYANVIALCTEPELQNKVSLFLQEIGHEHIKEVPDPYYGGEQSFEEVYKLLYNACARLSNRYVTK